jgi:hypothetical protein
MSHFSKDRIQPFGSVFEESSVDNEHYAVQAGRQIATCSSEDWLVAVAGHCRFAPYTLSDMDGKLLHSFSCK